MMKGFIAGMVTSIGVSVAWHRGDRWLAYFVATTLILLLIWILVLAYKDWRENRHDN